MFIDNFLIRIADLYFNPLLAKGKITHEQFSDLDIKFRQNAYNILVTFATLLAGYCFGMFLNFAIFYIAFNLVRNFSNGYHSYGNVTYCFIISMIFTFICCLLAICTPELFMTYFTLNIIFYFYVRHRAPYINNEEERKELNKGDLYYRLGTTISYIGLVIISFILYKFGFIALANTILLSNILVFLLMINLVADKIAMIRFIIYKK